MGITSIRIVSGIALAALAACFSGCAGTLGDTPEPGVAQQPSPSVQAAQAIEPVAPPPHMPKDLAPDTVKAADEFLWLEDVNGKKSLDWVKGQNAKTDSFTRPQAVPLSSGLSLPNARTTSCARSPS